MARILRLVLVIAVAGAFVAGTVVVLAPYGNEVVNANHSEDDDIDLGLLDSYAVRSYVYASDGTKLTTWHGPENRSPVTLDTVPQQVIDAVLSVEDADFYFHGGVNVKGTFRALIENVSAGDIAQGGSTLTQQLVKNAILTSDQNFGRKSQEAAIAVRLEQKLEKIASDNGADDPVKVAKDIILEKYLNTVYFGSGAYGVQAAAEVYWDKSVQDLNVGESAMLAALIRNPSGYDPTLHPEAAKKQRQIALDRMAQLGKITLDQARLYGQLPVPAGQCSGPNASASCGGRTETDVESFFLDELKTRLYNDESPQGVSPYGIEVTSKTYEPTDMTPKAVEDRRLLRKDEIEQGGYKIYTTLDPAAQEVADRVVAQGPPPNRQCVVAAMVGVEPGGAVRVMASGGYKQPLCPNWDVDPKDPEHDVKVAQANEPDKFNITTGTGNVPPGRPVGSSFKTFTLLTAFEQGNAPSDQIGGDVVLRDPDQTEVQKGCAPKMYCAKGPGGSLDSVTSASSNAAFVRLQQVVGTKNVLDVASKLGVDVSAITPGLSMTLGPSNIPPITMASAYSAIPNGGIYEHYYYVDRIEDRNGHVVFQHQGSGQPAVSKQSVCLATQVLQHNVEGGTGTNARLNRQVAAGKTGTSEQGHDTWFVGFTPYLSTAVWMGNPFSPDSVETNYIGGVENFGGKYPAKMWHDFNAAYHDQRDPKGFPTCAPPRGNGSVKGKGDNQLAFGFGAPGSEKK